MPVSAALSEAGDIVVLDNGGTRIRIGHVRNGQLHQHFETYSSQLLCVPDARQELLSMIIRYRDQHALTLAAAVLGIPGVLDRSNDVIEHCNNIPQLQGHGLRHFLRAGLGCQVLLEQDIVLQLLGERRAGAARGQSSVFGIYFGTGIGAAYLVDGKPNNPLVTDLQAGHIPIMAEGKPCKCGNTDCIEAYACGHTLTELAQKTGCPVEQLFEQRNEATRWPTLDAELDRFILYQAYMLATIGTLFTPDMLLIGGGIPLMAAYPREQLLLRTRRQLQHPYPADSIRFAFAELGTEASLHGALELLDFYQTQSTD